MFTAEGGLMCPSCRVGVEVMSYGGVFPPAVPFVGSGRGNGLEEKKNLLKHVIGSD